MRNIPESTYPYPLRPSELVKTLDLEAIPEENLSDEQKTRLRDFERPFFERISRLRDISISDHVIHPGAFVTEKGKKLFALTYLDPNLEERIKEAAQRLGLKWESEKDKKKASDHFFDDLEVNIDSIDTVPRLGDVREEDIVKLFGEVDLTRIPKRIRERLNVWSSKWAEDDFKKEFIKAQGEINLLGNPRKITRIVNGEDLREKEDGLRQAKKDIKEAKSLVE